ncbi:MAG: dihydropteroate synthase [Acidaminobacter sp.]|uniref:homocysteine S-methyltransferase family protein n=1 Tax=Acidaminobacter sp. TaxID=1872102 RepID=UPI001382010A|nr:homocysteine S-methyltransferase family protein [Acidaminobacter sp.]MZQ98422.1 dihydropteroate synthase [Acidaminobacter sp.]
MSELHNTSSAAFTALFAPEHLMIFDGAMGTMLQRYGMKPGTLPEALNLVDPALIQRIHREYLEAGSDVITTNTFGANAYKLSTSGYSVTEVVTAAVENAKAARGERQALIALDLGPIGKMMKPIGALDFDGAYEYFKEQIVAGVATGADLILIETMSDLGETRAAVLAAKENSSLPVFATMTFADDGRTLTGTDPEIMILSLEALGIDAIGVNCSLGPEELEPIIQRILAFAKVPVMVQANAGLPVSVSGRTEFSVDAATFADFGKRFVQGGVKIIGGCCGTTPEFIQALNGLRGDYRPAPAAERGDYVCSAQQKVALTGKFTLVGEKINPSGNKGLKAQFLAGNSSAAIKEAFDQINHGAEVLDVCTSLPAVDEMAVMSEIIEAFNGLIEAPLQFDSTKPAVLERALRLYSGVAIINSVNGKPSSMEKIFPIAKKYGAYIVALCLDENGIPETADGRMAVARKLIDTAATYGIDESRLMIDCLVLTASAQQAAVMETLKGIRAVKTTTRALTTLGLSNVSYGLPYRALINRTYFAMALTSGLDAVIIDPGAEGIMDTLMAFRVLANQDQGAVAYIDYQNEKADQAKQDSDAKDAVLAAAHASAAQAAALIGQLTNGSGAAAAVPPSSVTTVVSTAAGASQGAGGRPSANALPADSFERLLLEGQKDVILARTKVLLETTPPLDVVDLHLIPALDAIGQRYEAKVIFLPQLIRAAETVTAAFELIRAKLSESSEAMTSKGRVLLATVQGDVHDIGKNLVKVLLESYGYDVLDLGRDVPVEKVVSTAVAENIQLVGLSALMTTTVSSMEETIVALRATGAPIRIMVGGAVLTESYAKTIGADDFCRDARAGVSVAAKVFA